MGRRFVVVLFVKACGGSRVCWGVCGFVSLFEVGKKRMMYCGVGGKVLRLRWICRHRRAVFI